MGRCSAKINYCEGLSVWANVEQRKRPFDQKSCAILVVLLLERKSGENIDKHAWINGFNSEVGTPC